MGAGVTSAGHEQPAGRNELAVVPQTLGLLRVVCAFFPTLAVDLGCEEDYGEGQDGAAPASGHRRHSRLKMRRPVSSVDQGGSHLTSTERLESVGAVAGVWARTLAVPGAAARVVAG